MKMPVAAHLAIYTVLERDIDKRRRMLAIEQSELTQLESDAAKLKWALDNAKESGLTEFDDAVYRNTPIF